MFSAIRGGWSKAIAVQFQWGTKGLSDELGLKPLMGSKNTIKLTSQLIKCFMPGFY